MRSFILFFVLVVTGCTDFQVKNIAKSDIDMSLDVTVDVLNSYWEKMLVDLYTLNPGEIEKIEGMTVTKRKLQLLDKPDTFVFEELGNTTGVNTLRLVQSKEFEGDRVFALMVGIIGIVHLSYNRQYEFFISSSINPQAIYDCHVFIEELITLFATAPPSIKLGSQTRNNGFYVLMRKASAVQYVTAYIMENKTHRLINQGIRGIIATTVFPFF